MEVEIGPSVAGRWFSIRAEYQHFGPLRTLVGVVREMLFTFATIALFFDDWDPKRFCDVKVVRRDSGVVVSVFSYDHLWDADIHVRDLRQRLLDEPVFDFCRDIGLDIAHVAGAGQDPDPALAVRWVRISRRQRQRLARE
ncbi:hypothetical protein [Nocardioides marmorisolisilvae]|uniref:Uncharacterized protein n=1 Tax=Nocardioides marmorisolisilvae TaxID=1542737 RepID=A0A3N0DT63_9ACTN|nr:hypothetical protein [Nocardioides marmorisolisilvae]RNL78825.1 hypothetical protein EFL95_07100 [Nocardioides marmorisolisilvae]